MAAIAVTIDATYLRFGITLSAWAADGPVTVYRVHEDGTRWAVRGMSDVSGGSAFGYDYEGPLSAYVTYEATSGATLVQSVQRRIAVAPNIATLTVPGVPTMGGTVLPARKPKMSRSRPQAKLVIFGRAEPLVLSDTLKSPEFTLDLLTLTDAEAYALTATLEVSSTLLLRMPGARVVDWCYVSTGALEDNPAPYKGGLGEEVTEWSIPCQVTSPPVGGVFGDPTATYQARVDTGATYQDAVNSGRTYLDRLKGA